MNAIDWGLREWPTPLWGGRVRAMAWRARFYRLADDVVFCESVRISGFQNIRIGAHSKFMANTFLYANGSSTLAIGSRCSFNHGAYIDASGGQIIFGDNVLVGPNVVMRAADHRFDRRDIAICDQGHVGGSIICGDDVWLGAGVVVTRNVRIGTGVVVGAGSVVTRDLPDYSVCVGSPARVIRRRGTEESTPGEQDESSPQTL